ncbi:phosphatidylglycerophosphatase and protein-tyrosine phosphatase 1 isoform X2 [Chiloscyllium plagiosum]|uniref:phosphatidylglycerophosphatase and protein-tyrosine phosphatase 1 isoform X2 n=1 Tax=Chiloscyllium plagiosum TaxID=36176 RepID=UPI001CB7E319|nr:phosphatidylglycerophosphatase and protein-tyrosine phosphatase 1 isoform X2 [Chiloscyllium plagiosum]
MGDVKDRKWPLVMEALFARAVFLPSLGYNIFMSKVWGRHWYDRIDQTVIIGALPFRSLTHEEWESFGVEQLRLSTVDILGVPKLEDLRKGVDFLTKHRKNGTSVYVHCKAGRSRSATMVAAYLINLHHWTPKKACDYIASIRPHIIIRSGQFKILKSYYEDLFPGEPDILFEAKRSAAFK